MNTRVTPHRATPRHAHAGLKRGGGRAQQRTCREEEVRRGGSPRKDDVDPRGRDRLGTAEPTTATGGARRAASLARQRRAANVLVPPTLAPGTTSRFLQRTRAPKASNLLSNLRQRAKTIKCSTTQSVCAPGRALMSCEGGKWQAKTRRWGASRSTTGQGRALRAWVQTPSQRSGR